MAHFIVIYQNQIPAISKPLFGTFRHLKDKLSLEFYYDVSNFNIKKNENTKWKN